MKRIALVSAVLLVAAGLVSAAPPEVCRVQGGQTRTVWGAGFAPGRTEVLGWTAPYDEAAVKSALANPNYSAREAAPAEPPQGASKYTPLDIDPRGYVLSVDFGGYYSGSNFFDAMIGPDMIWVKNSDGTSKPWLVRAPQPWFVYPEKAAPGQELRLFGRNINAKLIAIKPAKGDDIIFFNNAPQSMYETSVKLPERIKPGAYQIYIHNGTCGAAGWGGPIALSVHPAPKPVTNILNVKDFGARGNGLADDTHAIRAALARATKTAPAIIFFPPGRYPIDRTLLVRPHITLKGAGMYNSTICVAPTRPIKFDIKPDKQAKMNGWFATRLKTGRAPMVWMLDNTSMTDLGFDDGPGVMQAAYVGHDNCRIERCRMYMPQATEMAVMVEWGSYGFVIKDCVIDAACGGIYVRHGPHEQVYVGGNKVRCTNPGTANNIFVRSFDRSIIENNVSSDADRNFVSQVGHASAYHSVLKGNSWFNNIPRRHNSGENMYESGNSMWRGKVAKATSDTITVAGQPFLDTPTKINTWQTVYETFVLIIDGRGLGQYRKVIGHTPNTLKLDKPWDITPDATTYITVGRAFADTLWLDNTEEHTANWTAWWGNCFGNVIDGQILRDGEGIYLWAYDTERSSPVAFNDVIGSEIIGRGQIKFIGPLVFGNTVRATEITDFRYRPSFHGSMAWAVAEKGPWITPLDPNTRFGIDFGSTKNTIKDLPPTAPMKDWNIIEVDNIYNGPAGIYISPDANHNVINHCQINVDGKKIVDESKTTVVK